MRRSTTAIVTILIVVLTIAIALIVADQSQYSNPIHTIDGVTLITTDQGDQVYQSVEYIKGNVMSVKPSAISTIETTPASLPNTSAPHGTHTCDMGTYQVTTDQSCDNLK
jgi:hypothetical protein